MKTEAEISHLWQLAHLKFYFGEKLAVHSMRSVDNPATESATCAADNEFRLNHLHGEFLESQTGSAPVGEKSVDVGGTKGFSEQSRKESAAPRVINPATRIA